MDHQRPWQPILERSSGEAALEAARAIAAALAAPSRVAAAPSASLAGGDAGQALFFAYLAQAFPGEGHEEMALERLERAIAALAEDSAGPSLCSGFAGVAWATAHLQRLLGLDASPDDPNQEIDEALEKVLDPSATALPSELLYGLAGIGVYYLERDPSASARLGLERVVERLEASAIPTPQGLAWTEAELYADGPDGAPVGEPRFNLGLSHGVPGAVLFYPESTSPRVELYILGRFRAVIDEAGQITPAMEVTNMSDMKQTENVKGKGKIGVLKLKRETLRELDAGELKQAQGGAGSFRGCTQNRRCSGWCTSAPEAVSR